MKTKLSPGKAVILAAGVLMLLGSFLPFYSALGFTFSSWSAGLFGIATVVVFCGVVMGAQVALATFSSGMQLPGKPFGLTWDQMHVALGFQATVMMLGFLGQRNQSITSYGTGFWMMFGAALGLFVGALMRLRPRRPRGLRSV